MKQSKPPQQPRQVTVQPQEPKPAKGGGPPAQAHQKNKRPRRVRPGAQDQRSGKDRDGVE